jgi:hypothetical protein
LRRPDRKFCSSWWLTVNFCRGVRLDLLRAAAGFRLDVLLAAGFRGLDLVFFAMIASIPPGLPAPGSSARVPAEFLALV